MVTVVPETPASLGPGASPLAEAPVQPSRAHDPCRAVPGRYDQAVADGDAAGLAGLCGGKHGRWGGSACLPDGHEASIEEPHWAATARAGRSRGWAAHLTTGERR